MFEVERRDEVLRLAAPGARWLSSGFDGGFRRADAAYNVTVPEGFDRTDLATYAAERRSAVEFPDAGPTLLTGVSQQHARVARDGPVTAVVTAGLSNPAALPMDPGEEADVDATDRDGDAPPRPGTVNVLVGTTHPLADGGLAGLLATAVEARTTTLDRTTGFPGTTSDAVVVGCPPGEEPASFAGSATEVGTAARACVRDALRASLASRYADEPLPVSVADARYGTTTTRRADVFAPGE
jgi:adenosylcobinamide hydrolase